MAKMIPTISPDDLHAEIDPTGQPIRVGTRVRSFDISLGYKAVGEIVGTDVDGSLACFVEGVVEEMGVNLEGCPRYRILADTRMMQGEHDALPAERQRRTFYPPVNGTRSSLGGRTAGVFVIN